MKRIMIGRIRLRYWWHRNRPVFCFSCGRVIRRKNAHNEVHYGAGLVLLCGECDRRLHLYDGGRR